MGAARKHTYWLISANKELQFYSKLKHIDIFGMTDIKLKKTAAAQKKTKVGRPSARWASCLYWDTCQST